MRFALYRLFRESPFQKLLEHADTVHSGGKPFRDAIACYLDGECDEFERLHREVSTIESQADKIKGSIRGHLPKGVMMPMDKSQFLWYLREQDKVMDAMQDALHWLSYRTTLVPEGLTDDFTLMADKAVEVIDQLPVMVKAAISYFDSLSNRDRQWVKDVISEIRRREVESDRIERKLKSDVFAITVADPGAIFHLIRLIEYLGEISNHAENAGDMMRAMIAR